MNQEIPDIQAVFRKGRGTRDQIVNIHWTIEKAREFQKNIYFCFTDSAKAFLWVTTNCGKFLKRREHQTTLHASWEICMQVKKQQLEPDTEQWSCSKLGKEYVKAIYCHLAYLTYMQSTSCEMLGLMKHKLESRLPGGRYGDLVFPSLEEFPTVCCDLYSQRLWCDKAKADFF